MNNKGKEQSHLIIYNRIELQKDVDNFSKDEDALACFWNYKDEQCQMLDNVSQIHDAITIMNNQDAQFVKIVEKKGMILVILHVKEGKGLSQPPIDPLAYCLGYSIPGFVFVLKKICWECRSPLKEIDPCKTCGIEFYCDKKSCFSNKDSCYIKSNK